MKIEGINHDLFLKINKSESGMKKIKEVLEQINVSGEPVEVSISKEGYVCYRNSLLNLEEYTPQRKPTQEELDINEFCLKAELYDPKINILHDLEELGKEYIKGKDSKGTGDIGSGFFEAYATLYDRISSEHAEKYIWADDYSRSDDNDYILTDSNGKEYHFRKVTKEEELKALDSAYEHILAGLKEYFDRLPEMKKFSEEYKKELERLRSHKQANQRKAEAEKREEEKKPELSPEDLIMNMRIARSRFQNKYSGFNTQAEVLKGMANIVDKLFIHYNKKTI